MHHMPGIIAAFEQISANFNDVDHLAFSMDEKRIRIFYADMDETIDHMLSTCGRIAHGSAKQTGIGEIFYDTFLGSDRTSVVRTDFPCQQTH